MCAAPGPTGRAAGPPRPLTPNPAPPLRPRAQRLPGAGVRRATTPPPLLRRLPGVPRAGGGRGGAGPFVCAGQRCITGRCAEFPIVLCGEISSPPPRPSQRGREHAWATWRGTRTRVGPDLGVVTPQGRGRRQGGERGVVPSSHALSWLHPSPVGWAVPPRLRRHKGDPWRGRPAPRRGGVGIARGGGGKRVSRTPSIPPPPCPWGVPYPVLPHCRHLQAPGHRPMGAVCMSPSHPRCRVRVVPPPAIPGVPARPPPAAVRAAAPPRAHQVAPEAQPRRGRGQDAPPRFGGEGGGGTPGSS